MRRSRWLMMMLAALLVWWAVRVVPEALGFAKAKVTFGGSLSVGAPSFVGCDAADVAFPSGTKNGSVPVKLTCTNRTTNSVTIRILSTTLDGGPANATRPTIGAWSPTTIVLPAATAAAPAQTGTATLTVSKKNQTTSGTTYTLTFTTSSSATSLLSYSKNHSVSVTVP